MSSRLVTPAATLAVVLLAGSASAGSKRWIPSIPPAGGGGGATQPGIAQSVWTNSVSQSPVKLTLPSVGNGSLVVVLMMRAGTGVADITAANSISDTVAGYQLDGSSGTLTANIKIAALSRRTAAAGTLNIFLTNSTSGNAINACAYEITNAASANWLDYAQVNNITGSGTAVTSAQFNTSTNDVILFFEGDGSSGAGTTHTATAPFAISAAGTAHVDSGATFWSAGAMDFKATTPRTNQQAQMTLGNAQTWTCLMAAYGGQAHPPFISLTTLENGNSGDTLTTNNMNASTFGVVSNWQSGPTAGQALSAQVLTGWNTNLSSSAGVAGTLYDGSGTRVVGMRNDLNEKMSVNFPVALSNVTVGFFFTPGMTNPADSTFYDAAFLLGSLDFAVFSVQMVGTAPTTPVKVHTQAGSSAGTITLLSPVLKSNTYWAQLTYIAGDKAYLNIWSNATQVGSEISLGTVSNFPVASFGIGQNHAVTPPSQTVSLYDNILIDPRGTRTRIP